MGVGSRVGRVGGRHGLGLLEALPVGVGPGQGGAHGGGEGGHGHALHLDREATGAKQTVVMKVMLVLLPLPGLDIVLLQGDGSWLTVNLLIKSTGVTNYVAS